MTVRNYYGLAGTLAETIGSASSIIPVSPSVSGAIIASGFINDTDAAYFAISTGNLYELVRVTQVVGNNLTVTRAQGGTIAQAFPVGSSIAFEVTSEAIIAQIGVLPDSVTLIAEGIVSIVEDPDDTFTIGVVEPTFSSGDGRILVMGSWPSYSLAYNPPEDDCCGPSTPGSGGITSLVGVGIAQASVTDGEGTITVVEPTFNSGSNISITGAWPEYTISATIGTGTVGSVTGGAGITITGSPSVNPTVSLTNTGVVPGTYGDVVINSKGQFTSVAATFDPISILNVGPGLGDIRVGGTVTLSVDTAAVGVAGIAELADSTSPFDPLDDTSIATPAVVANALASVISTDITGASAYTAEATVDYTNIVGATTTAITLLAGESALVQAECTIVGGTPLTPSAFAMAIFDGSSILVKGNRKITQSQQSMAFLVVGPVATAYTLVTTVLGGGETVQSYALHITKF